MKYNIIEIPKHISETDYIIYRYKDEDTLEFNYQNEDISITFLCYKKSDLVIRYINFNKLYVMNNILIIYMNMTLKYEKYIFHLNQKYNYLFFYHSLEYLADHVEFVVLDNLILKTKVINNIRTYNLIEI